MYFTPAKVSTPAVAALGFAVTVKVPPEIAVEHAASVYSASVIESVPLPVKLPDESSIETVG